MKKFGMYLSVLAMALIVMTSCKKDDDPVTPVDNPKPSAAKDLMATSNDSNAIYITWSPSDSASSALFDGYQITVIKPTVMAPVNVGKNDTVCNLTGLQQGLAYEIQVVAKYTNGEYSPAITTTWATAKTFTKDVYGDQIRLYATNVLDQGSGLNFYDADSKGPKVLRTADFENWCIGFNNATAGSLKIGHPDVIGYNKTTSKDVEIGPMYGADDALETNSFNSLDTYAYSKQSFDLSTESQSVVFLARVKDSDNKYNYVKVLVVYENGSFIHTDQARDYIVVKLSYQTLAGLPYAK
jgi:hypothetical protein